ncbi:hypothetical protein KTO58_24880 [Chitinophaga pendula]|uniref:hypothetical protein n=1 Tax=Chitinophaga TaxID=79328 RepID=UPI000BB03B8E|nr:MULTISPECIES: hypothetical protein [Chitinophaga]ASZ10183.1 hypothetical protein CK934_03890 [Chitinophaga sp. MD30]UCJ06862.1 hypothetical protein KTO58_24880 [Chitinophaga pendula]
MNRWTMPLICSFLAALNACQPKGDHNAGNSDSTHITTPAKDTAATTEVAHAASREITVGKHSVGIAFQSKEDNGQSLPETQLTVKVNGQEILHKKYTAMFSFLDKNSFQQTNPIPKDADIVLACGGEFAETGSFLYIKQEKNGCSIYELLTGQSDNSKNTPTLLKTVK